MRAIVLCGFALLLAFSTLAQDDIDENTVSFAASIDEETALYTGPGQHFDLARTVPAGATFTVYARDESGLWLLARMGDIVGGWVPGGSVILPQSADLYTLSISSETVESAAPSPHVTMLEATEDAETLALAQRLLDVPIFYNFDSDTLAGIVQTGIDNGRRAGVFTRVGDSDTTSGDYLRPIGMRGDFCEYGPYAYLEETVAFFNEPPRRDVPNSFDAGSIAAVNGLTMTAVLDPIWTSDAACHPNESPLSCEYRLTEASIALIMLGRMDVTYFDAGFYEESTRRVLETSIDAGVIPVLTTFVVPPDNEVYEASIVFNNVLVDLATAYDVPLINLWRGVQTLPRHGIGPDETHLSHAVGEFCSFDGPQFAHGGTLRNLLSLLALDDIRRSLIAER